MTTTSIHTLASHDGADLKGHLYLPEGPGPFPAVVMFNGGGWKTGDKLKSWKGWGEYLAGFGIAALAASYRDSVASHPMYHESLGDAQAAVRYLRGHADQLHIDGDRIAAFGDSAGGHLAAQSCLVPAVDGGTSTSAQTDGRRTDANVETVVSVYGIFDLIQQWEHDQLCRPDDQITERYLGGCPATARELFYEASPLVHASRAAAAGTRWLLLWGDRDPVVDGCQSEIMARHLQRAGALVRTEVLPGAGHYWFRRGSLDSDAAFSPAAVVAPRIKEFLLENL